MVTSHYGRSPGITVPSGGGEGLWVWRSYCTTVSFAVVSGEHWVIWTGHCSLPVSGGLGDADGHGIIQGATIVADASNWSGLYEVEINATGTLTFTPTHDSSLGSAGQLTLLAHQISGSFDRVNCE